MSGLEPSVDAAVDAAVALAKLRVINEAMARSLIAVMTIVEKRVRRHEYDSTVEQTMLDAQNVLLAAGVTW